jgi:hypothetical protein
MSLSRLAGWLFLCRVAGIQTATTPSKYTMLDIDNGKMHGVGRKRLSETFEGA